MKTRLQKLFAAAAIAFVLFAANDINAQTGKRIKFAKGSRSATVAGTIKTENSSVNYLLGAKAGQKLTVNFEPDAGSALPVVMIYPPGKSADDDKILDEGGGGEYEVDLTASGDYSIVVACVKRCRYSLTVTIE